MNIRFNRLGGFPGNESSLTGKVRKYRKKIRSFLLISLLSVGAVSFAGTINEAAKSGDLEQVQRLVVEGADVNAKTTRNETSLMIASLAGQGEIVNYLLQRGADIDARNSSGLSSLHAAAYAGRTDIVSLLVAKGAEVNDAANRFGVTPLHLAAEENQIETVQELLSHGADVAAIEVNGYSVLSRAGFREHWDVVEILLASGAACQAADKVGDWLYQECTTRANAI